MTARSPFPRLGTHAAVVADAARWLVDRDHESRDGRPLAPAVRLQAHELVLHGHRLRYRTAGSGPPLVLLHGIAGSSTTWQHAAPWLARRFTLIAPDFLGHGESAKPRGDYSLGAHASVLRDLLSALGHDRVTVVGHSLGGGVALQFVYLFPERCERLVLVASGGLGREVHLALRAAALPGADLVLPFAASRAPLQAGRALAGLLGAVRMRPGRDLEEIARGFASLDNAASRQAFLHTLRAVVEPGGQRVSALDRLSLAAVLPTLLVWGSRDPIIPVSHGIAAQRAMPGSHISVLDGAGHFPHLDDPRRFAAIVTHFHGSTDAVRLPQDHWRPSADGDGETTGERCAVRAGGS